MRVKASPKILVVETFETFFALMSNLMKTVYWPWGNRLRIHQVWGSLKLIRVDKTSNLFLISSFPLYILVFKCLMLLKKPEQAEGGLEMK